MIKKHKVLVADAQFLSRQGLKSMLQQKPFYEVVGEVKRHDELEHFLNNHTVDVVVIDYNQNGNFGVESISMVTELQPTTRIVVLSDDDNKRTIYEVLERGISNFVTKKCDEYEIERAIDSSLKNQKYYCSKILDIIVDKSFGSPEKAGGLDLLTEREKDILTMFATGKMAKEMASELNISIHTIYTHRKNIMKKLEINSPVELIMFAVNNGLVDI
jgi:DNA-binding NarL/FixJ family response regulator